MQMFRFLLAALAVAAVLPSFVRPAAAHDGVHVVEAYARVSSPVAKSGAAFMVIENHSDQPDRLISATADVAERTELHTHIDAGNGVMQMREVEGGFPVPGKGTHVLGRGGDHVMLMGLKKPLRPGDIVTLTLTFERGDVVVLEVPVDLERGEAHGAHGGGDHSAHGGVDHSAGAEEKHDH
ncbi:copper chaperone PCu(A)C [Fertoebacter nigrum]|uniref:Copper chaperone PCu(A)C n=1 Tax=Fertoeibacter niger TaxID=2656921 RepID=A0A8X8KP32_9RHOB|nr:copper chaperone PCu(A)C [Fertoeibacter niger]